VITIENPAAGRYPIAALALALMLAGTLLPTPLFELYHRTWNLTPAEISLVFAVYAASLIPSLIFLGGLSDSIGRRRTILLAFAVLAVGSLIFAFADGVPWLIAARIVQGVGMGLGTGAAAAAIREWMPENQRGRAGMVTVIAVAAGSALGALMGGILAEYAPHPLSLAYFVHVGLVAAAAVAVARVPKCPHPRPFAHSVVPTIPPAIRRPFFIASAQAFIGWGSFAIFVGLVPTFLANALNLHNLLTGAFVITGIQIGSVTASIFAQRLTTRWAIILALLTLGAGMWLLLLGVALHAYVLVAVATLVTGAGGGLSYLVGLNIVAGISPPEHRAEMLSAFLVACYLGFSVPALALGIAANEFGLFAAFIGTAVVLGAIATTIIALTSERNLRVA
jgi:MFS family permease